MYLFILIFITHVLILNAHSVVITVFHTSDIKQISIKKIVQRAGARMLIFRVNLGFESSYSWNHWMELLLGSQDKTMTKPKFECIIKKQSSLI